MVVDDDRTSLALTKAFIERIGHPVQAFNDPREALDAIQERPPKILVTDMVMPDLSGTDLAAEARKVDPDIGVVLISGYGDGHTAEATLGLSVSQFIAKPVERETLSRAMQKAYMQRAADEHHRAMVNWMYEALEKNATAIRDVTLGTLASLVNAMDARSPHFRGHSKAVAIQAAAVAQELGLDDRQIEEVRVAGLLHDIGMIGVSDAIVDKPETLTSDEADLVFAHCEAGVGIIEPMKHLGQVSRFVLEHHERWDGSGYPDGKKGDEISLGGQIVGIAEAWTAIKAGRAYREGRSWVEALDILVSHQSEWFTEEVTAALIESDVGVM